MDNHVTLGVARRRLEERGMKYEVLPLGGDCLALVTQYGGRLLGPFHGEEGESALWLSRAFLNETSFGSLIEGRGWNIGGERLWVNPELKFFCKTPETFDETYTVQDALDPGSYKITLRDGGVELEQSPTIKVLGTGREKSFLIRRRYTSAVNPLRHVASLKGAPIAYCGYAQDIFLKDTSPDTPMCLEPWILTQINPAGHVVTPFFGAFDFVNYYEPVGDRQRVLPGYAELDITGQDKYKVAYRSAQTFGRMAYVKRAENSWLLMVRNYYNDPSIAYLSEPWGNLGDRGCSTYYYNDHGREDGFAEFENSGQVVDLGSGRGESSSTTSLWFFKGAKGDIHAVMENLLGIDYKFHEEEEGP